MRFKLPPLHGLPDQLRFAFDALELFLNKAIGDIERDAAAITATPTKQSLSALMQNGWTVYDAANTAFWKDSLGYVHLVGELSKPATAGSGAAGAAIFGSLPTGYTPTLRHYFPVARESAGGNAVWIAQITTGGQFQVSDLHGGIGATAWTGVNLGHLTWPTF